MKPPPSGDMWFSLEVEGAKPYVRATSTAEIWEFVWPDATGNGHDAVRLIRPADVAELMADRDRLFARVRELEHKLRSQGIE